MDNRTIKMMYKLWKKFMSFFREKKETKFYVIVTLSRTIGWRIPVNIRLMWLREPLKNTLKRRKVL